MVRDALGALGVQRLLVGVFDSAFPAVPGEDLGRGSPCSRGAARFLAFARELGFTGVQLGPQGLVSASNPSPYDGALFSRNPLNLGLERLVDEGLLQRSTLEALAASTPPRSAARADHAHAFAAHQAALDEVFATHRHSPEPRRAALEFFWREHHDWLLPDSLYEPLCAEHGGGWHGEWGEFEQARLDRQLFSPAISSEVRAARLEALRARHAEAVDRYALLQLLAHQHHRQLRAEARALDLELYGDLQVGASPRDVWARQALYLDDYRMGAPPSRTTPEGQPWGYPVLDPELYRERDGSPGPAVRFLQARVGKLLDEYGGLRIDHPHGLVCPWVYRAGQPDPIRAVQEGARLFCSPDQPGHPRLRRYAIPRPEQIDHGQPPHADGWVRSLEPEQVDRYAALFDAVVALARARGLDASALVAEVLSTLPFPLRCVLQRHGLGRFRVTQKANLREPGDVYRSENAVPGDWMMLGNHDTPTIWAVAARKQAAGTLAEHADYLAQRLSPPGPKREALARSLLAEPGLFAQAALADLLASPGGNVLVFFNDLLGLVDPFNVPGTISDQNWSLRVPPDFAERYPERRRHDQALNLPRALAMALRARGSGHPAALAAALDRLAQE